MRPGNAHSADGWRDLLEPIIDKYKTLGKKLYLYADAAFASPDIAETVVLHARAGRHTVGKAGNGGFGVLTCPHLGRTDLSGDAYGK